jgi:hypothetical protein
VLLDASGLQPSSKGWRLKYSGEKRTVIDGPFAETKELIAGYTLIQVKSREEAMEWARRFPNPAVNGKETCLPYLPASFGTATRDLSITVSGDLAIAHWLWRFTGMAEDHPAMQTR